MKLLSGNRIAAVVLFFTGFYLLISCNPSRGNDTRINSFYYWKGNFEMHEKDIERLKALNVKKLYLKFFDVAYNTVNGPHPQGQLFFATAIPDSFEIVPVVFITNQCFLKSDSQAVAELAEKMASRILTEIKRTRTGNRVKEVQIDCDWTKSTRDKYFFFLQQLSKGIKYKLSATIRLHQYKYNKNNVPPVDRGLLMCYNVDILDDPNTSNSLFSKSEAMKYIEGVTYPLPLDLAFPVYSWGIEFRQQSFEGIVNGITRNLLDKTPAFTLTDKPNTYRCTRDTLFFDHHFTAGNTLRVEEVNFADLKEVGSYLKEHIPNDTASIILFHYDEKWINDDNQKEISDIFTSAH
jgi:hypothetical protein